MHTLPFRSAPVALGRLGHKDLAETRIVLDGNPPKRRVLFYVKNWGDKK